MKRKETPETVRRVREIYRRHSVPRVTAKTNYSFVQHSDRARRIFDRMREGFELRDYR